jgi:molecular chaperone DnaJ
LIGNADAQKCFQEVAEAYSILSDSEKRAKFDLSQNEPQNDDWEGVRRSSFSESFHSSVDAEDMFRKIFGSFRDEFGQPNKKAWVDFPEGKYGHSESQEVAVNLSFKEAAKGCEKLINVNVVHVCEKCNGTRSPFLYYFIFF